jgi:hypothetical protein
VLRALDVWPEDLELLRLSRKLHSPHRLHLACEALAYPRVPTTSQHAASGDHSHENHVLSRHAMARLTAFTHSNVQQVHPVNYTQGLHYFDVSDAEDFFSPAEDPIATAPTAERSTTCVVMWDDDRAASYARESHEVNRAYARRHGYAFLEFHNTMLPASIQHAVLAYPLHRFSPHPCGFARPTS